VATPAPRTIVPAVRAFARRHGIFRPGPLVVAVSGGTDSIALALVLAEIREEFGLVLHIAHFDHRTRPRSAPKDAAFVAELANRIGAPIRVGRAERAPKNEDDARRDRYSFLRRFASEIGAGAIATGHTMDDQAETVLLHLTRGSGLAGVAAMRPLRDGIARPLLAIGRAETHAMCLATKIKPREDPSNKSLKFARNRVRQRVLPELERINPQVRAALARFADAAADLEARLADEAATAATAASAATGDSTRSAAAPAIALDGSARARSSKSQSDVGTTTLGVRELDVRDLPSDQALRERALADAWVAAGGITLSARHRHALAKLASSTAGSSRIDLPGGQAIREYGRLRVGHAIDGAVTRTAANTVTPVTLARGAQIAWHGWRIALDMPTDGLPYSGAVDENTATNLAVRARRPGDRIPRQGKLQDVFVDAKIPARHRDAWPVVTLDDAVIWVPGLTPPPQSGAVAIAAGRAERHPTKGEYQLGSPTPERQVASKTGPHRPRGGNRGRA
jgi:tRNA(Ile)-lysidine synthase